MHIISGYHVTDHLYESDRSIVYRGRRETDDLPVILKLLKDLYPPPEAIARFRHEYELIHRLNIPGVVQAYALETNQQQWLMVLEDFGGRSLRQLQLPGKLNLGDFFHLAIILTDTIGQIHQHHIMHKDINPSNIVFNPSTRQVKVIDFGIATLLSRENPTFRNPNVLEGTMPYMSPEQTGRMNRAMDYRTDFYSLGVTLYELLTGHLPFYSEDTLEMIHQHIAMQPASPHTLLRRSGIQVGRTIKYLSEVILKLMAKNAEDRYQSAYGLKKDLEIINAYRLESRADESGRASPPPIATGLSFLSSHTSFIPGQHDLSDRFDLPQTLYGREQDSATLLASFERVSQGACALMLVTGAAGIGKSALVQELYRPITQQRGYLAFGKFDQLQRNIPYSALIQALRSLLRDLLTEGEQQIATWKQKFLSAFGNNGQVIIEVIPEVELIVGPQPDVASLPPAEAQNRFTLFFQHFIHVLSQPEHPLIIFLDDLQWADRASLILLERLLASPDSSYLFVIGAYRESDVEPDHPLNRTLDTLHETRVSFHTLSLTPLDRHSITRMVCDTLHCDKATASPLAELMETKTGGNPFFLGEFLKSLYAKELLSFNYQRQCWQWDMARIQALDITDNVVDLLTSNILQLPSQTQEVLKLAACIGTRFSLATLALVVNESVAHTARNIEQAVLNGLIIPLTGTHTVMTFEIEGLAQAVNVEYKFAHDRIHHALYSLISLPEREQIHWRIGNLLLHQYLPAEQPAQPAQPAQATDMTSSISSIPDPGLDEYIPIFDIVNHLNYGRALASNQHERYRLAELNRLAGSKARASAAYEPAFQYFQTGLELIGQADGASATSALNPWQNRYDLTLALHVEAAEAAYLSGHTAQMKTLCAVVLDHATSLLDKVKVYEVKIASCIVQNRLLDAVHTGLHVLKLLDMPMPATPNMLHIVGELAQARLALIGKNTEYLARMPEMTDPYHLAAIRILSSITSPSYIATPLLFPLIILKQLRLSIAAGNTSRSTFVYSGYGIIQCGVLRNPDAGYRFGELALRLLDHYQVGDVKAKTLMAVAHFIYHWKKPLQETAAMLQEVYHTGLENGDLESAGYAAFMYPYHAYLTGHNLAALEAQARSYGDALARMGNQTAAHYHAIFSQAIANMLGHEKSPTRLQGECYNETTMLPHHYEASDGTALYYVYFNKLMLCYWFGEYAQAVTCARLAHKYAANAAATPSIPVLHFYDSLARLALIRQKHPANIYAFHRARIAANQRKLRFWAKHAPANYQHKYYLVEAERARLAGNSSIARESYDKAITHARTHGYINDEALACELASRFYLEQHNREIAQLYFRKAHYAYTHWGAHAKVNQLETHYADLIPPAEASNSSDSTTTRATTARTRTRTTTTTTTTSQNLTTTASTKHYVDNLDLNSVMKASQAISSEIVLENLLSKMMRIVIENAAAERGVLLLERESMWLIAAEGHIEQEDVAVFQSVGLNNAQVPHSIINYVRNTHEDVVLGNAPQEGAFTNDSYVAAYYPRSILCTPLLHQGKLTGILYLENNLTSNTFTPERLEVLRMLSSQAAISIENARLYSERMRLTAIEHELTLAHDIQCTLLPPSQPDWSNLDMVCYTIPAREVGGDLYAYHALDDSHYAIAVGDVSGKGMPAALLMAASVASFRSLVVQRLAPATFLAQMDTALASYIGSTRQNCALVYLYQDLRKTCARLPNLSHCSKLLL